MLLYRQELSGAQRIPWVAHKKEGGWEIMSYCANVTVTVIDAVYWPIISFFGVYQKTPGVSSDNGPTM